jgi:hypothetical protein
MAGEFTEKDLSGWMPVSEAIKLAEAAYGDFALAANTLAGRLKIAAIRAGAEYSGIEGAGKLTGVVEIAAQHWGLLRSPTHAVDFWRTGELLLLIPSRVDVMGVPYGPGDYVRYLGVRIEPIAFRALLAGAPNPPAPAAATPSAPPKESDEGDAAKPRIQDDWLTAWAELFNRFYSHEDAEFALKSARGMFHDKRVARDRVRPLVQRPRGRRPSK